MVPTKKQPMNNNEKNIERIDKKDLGSRTRLDRSIGDCADTKQINKIEINSNKR